MIRMLLGLFALLLLSGQAQATPLRAEFSFVASADSSLDGTPFGSLTDITVSALFESTGDTDPTADVGLFLATVTFDIAGIGLVESAPGADVYVYLALRPDPRHDVGLFDATGTVGFFGLYGTYSSDTPDAPVAATFSGYQGFGTALPFVIPTVAHGDLVLVDLDDFSSTAQLVDDGDLEVAAPAALWLFVPLVAGLALRRRRA